MKTLLHVSLLSIFCCFVLSSAVAQSSEHAPRPLTRFDQVIANAEREFVQAMDRGDVAAVKNAVADDFVGISSNGDTDSKADLLEGARLSKLPKPGEKPMIYFFSVVPLNEAAAVVTYDTVRPGDFPRYLHVSRTWVKQGDSWKLKFEQETPNLWSANDFD
jgi:hypothetical protein